MIKEVTRSHIKVELDGMTITVPGEMFFPENDKLGFAVFSDAVKHWDAPNASVAVTPSQLEQILADIRSDFEKGGHVLVVE
jgi:hypothetical protein